MLTPKKDKQDLSLYMASLDVDSLFTSIPLDKTIDICIDILYKDDKGKLKIVLIKIRLCQTLVFFNPNNDMNIHFLYAILEDFWQ